MEDSNKLAQLRVATNVNNPNIIRTEQVIVKGGPRTYKTATLLYIGEKKTGEIKTIKLMLKSYGKHPDGKYDFENPDYNWYCEGDEIHSVQALLNTEFPDAGTFQLVAQDSGLNRIAQLVNKGNVNPEELEQLAQIFSGDEARSILANSEAGQLLASALQLQVHFWRPLYWRSRPAGFNCIRSARHSITKGRWCIAHSGIEEGQYSWSC
jgi:hypothetical protein